MKSKITSIILLSGSVIHVALGTCDNQQGDAAVLQTDVCESQGGTNHMNEFSHLIASEGNCTGNTLSGWNCALISKSQSQTVKVYEDEDDCSGSADSTFVTTLHYKDNDPSLCEPEEPDGPSD